MRIVVIVGANTPAGRAALECLGGYRADFILDGLVDEGTDPRWLAEQVVRFTPLRLGITDDYAVSPVLAERAELTRDAGLVDWELPELMVCSGSGAIAEVAGLPADIVIVCLPGIPGQIAVTAAAQAGTGQIWWSCPAGKELRLPDGVRQVAGDELPGLLLAAR